LLRLEFPAMAHSLRYPLMDQGRGETMHHAKQRAALRCIAGGSLLALGALVLSTLLMAADAHRAVQVQHGESVVLRNVSARPAYREAPPGMALIVNPSPRHELDRALNTGELSDEDYANLNATASTSNRNAHGTTVERMTGSALGNSLGSRTSSDVTGNDFSHVIAAPMGGVGRATGGIGDQVQGALSQLPGLTPSGPSGH